MTEAAMRQGDIQWQSGCGPTALSASEVHVWKISLEQSPELIRAYEGILSSDERRRAEDPSLEKERECFSLCRGFLRMLLGRYGGIAPEAIRFQKGKQGKLILDPSFPDTDIEFTLSHSGRVALFALANGRRLGVDVEKIRATARLEEIARNLFSPAETEAIRGLPEDMRVNAFYACWTRKEAVTKALGGSIVELLDKVIVSTLPAGPAQLLQMPSGVADASAWRLHDLPVGEGYAAALCHEGHDAEVLLWESDE